MSTEPSTTNRLSRRQILFGGAGAVVAAGVSLSLTGQGRGLLDLLPFVEGGPRQPLDRTPMSERIGETFTARDGEGTRVVLTLSAVDDLPIPSQTHNFEGQFVARFRGPLDTPLTQDTYRFNAASFGDVDVFIVPGAVDELGIDYSAVFNRMPPEVTP
jgi:hypothetical protein